MNHLNHTPNQVKDYLTVAGITLLIMCALPILAIMALTLQFSFIIVAPVLLVSVIAIVFGRRSGHIHQITVASKS